MIVNDAGGRLNHLDDTILNLNPGNAIENVENSITISGEANDISNEVNVLADAMRDQINSAPDPNVPVEDELVRTQESCRKFHKAKYLP